MVGLLLLSLHQKLQILVAPRWPSNGQLHHRLPIPAGDDQRCGSIGLGCNEFGHFFLRLVVQEDLKIIAIYTSVYDQ